MSTSANVGAHLALAALRSGTRIAVIEPDGRTNWRAIDYFALDRRCDSIAHGLTARGLTRGDRVAIFVRPGIDLIALVFALFKLGAVPVLIDPGMGRASFVRCLARARPRALVGVSLAHLVRKLHARELASIEIAVQVGRQWIPRTDALDDIVLHDRGPFAPAPMSDTDVAAILFTSGSTGPAKGVVYTHAMFQAQITALRALYAFRPGEIDLACFPLFALFDAALEATCVIPRLDPSHPGRCDPRAIAEALLAHRCTYSFGSPAIWSRIAPWASERGVRFDDLERVMIAGAPVAPELVHTMRALLAEHGDVHTPYGATECLPVTSISGAEIAAVRAQVEGGFGTCVGRAAPGVEIALIDVDDARHEHWSDDRVLSRGAIGEVCVRGNIVTREYADDALATAHAKIDDGRGHVWHRMGDAGWIDDEGRLWIVGRKSHRIETPTGTVWPVPIENMCNVHPRVRRTALVGVGVRGAETPVLFVEPHRAARPRDRRSREQFVREIAAVRRAIQVPGSPALDPGVERMEFETSFPVDVRHNAKIRREDLKRRALELE